MRLKSIATTVVVALMLVLGIDYLSFAKDGRSLILGKANYANGPTSITRTGAGAALTVYSRPGRPPIRVNRPVKAPNLNADLLDGKHASAFATKRSPVQVHVAPAVPGRDKVLADKSSVVVQQVALDVPAECGTNTRHRYLAEYSAWGDSDGLVRTSVALDSTGIFFGESFRIVSEGRNSLAGSRVLTLAPGAHSIRLVADRFGGTNGELVDPSFTVTDLGYSCSGGATTSSRTAQPRAGSGPDGR